MEILFLASVYVAYILSIYLKYKFPHKGILFRYERDVLGNSLDISNLIKPKKYTNEEIQEFKEKCKLKLLIHLSLLFLIILLVIFKSFFE